MSDEISQIRGLLDTLEGRIVSTPDEKALRDFAALELPEIVADIIGLAAIQKGDGITGIGRDGSQRLVNLVANACCNLA